MASLKLPSELRPNELVDEERLFRSPAFADLTLPDDREQETVESLREKAAAVCGARPAAASASPCSSAGNAGAGASPARS